MRLSCFLLFLLQGNACCWGFAPPVLSAGVVSPEAATTTTAPSDIATTVAVTGATGRTGRLVVQELLDRGGSVNKVVAVVRDMQKARQELPVDNDRLECIQCDLTNPKAISDVFGNSIDATIWCATGFSNAEVGWMAKAKQIFGMALAPQQSIDLVGLPAIAKTILPNNKDNRNNLPQVVMCSSGGVTRPTWSEAKKKRFPGAADIPIVRLNPFSILDRKRESEDELRKSGVNYCIVRPCGLNDDWPSGSRPVLSQGDVAVGRINRRDVARLLVDVLFTPEATGKTFEVVGLAGYPPPASVAPALERLYSDDEALVEDDDDRLAATYAAMQQLLPGEKQDAAALAMGQTYEQLDKGETGRLGERGKEDAEGAAPKPTS